MSFPSCTPPRAGSICLSKLDLWLRTTLGLYISRDSLRIVPFATPPNHVLVISQGGLRCSLKLAPFEGGRDINPPLCGARLLANQGLCRFLRIVGSYTVARYDACNRTGRYGTSEPTAEKALGRRRS